jgi:hypothetical protein
MASSWWHSDTTNRTFVWCTLQINRSNRCYRNLKLLWVFNNWHCLLLLQTYRFSVAFTSRAGACWLTSSLSNHRSNCTVVVCCTDLHTSFRYTLVNQSVSSRALVAVTESIVACQNLFCLPLPEYSRLNMPLVCEAVWKRVPVFHRFLREKGWTDSDDEITYRPIK